MSHPMYLSSATNTDGTQILLSYDSPLSYDTAPASSFIVTVDSAPVQVTGVVTSATDNTKVELSLATAIPAGSTVVLDYNDPTYDDDPHAIQSVDNYGYSEDAYSLISEVVVNNSTFSPASGSNQSLSDPLSPLTIHLEENSGAGQIIYVAPSVILICSPLTRLLGKSH